MIKKIKILNIGALLILLVLFFIYGEYSKNIGKKEFIQKSYRGTITEIMYFEGRRGLPDIKVDTNWISIDILESKVKNFIQIGDSIIKESGTQAIKIYRKDKNGKWNVKIFK